MACTRPALFGVKPQDLPTSGAKANFDRQSAVHCRLIGGESPLFYLRERAMRLALFEAAVTAQY